MATSNLWDNIQIVKTCILKHNVFNLVSLAIRYLDFETLYYHFEYISDEVIYYVLDNIEDTKKIYFLTQKYICYSYTLGKIYQHNFSKNPIYFSEPLNNYSSYYNIAFLYKKSEAAEAIKLFSWIWSNTISYSVKRLHTDNKREYVVLELEFFLKEQEIIYKTSTVRVKNSRLNFLYFIFHFLLSLFHLFYFFYKG